MALSEERGHGQATPISDWQPPSRLKVATVLHGITDGRPAGSPSRIFSLDELPLALHQGIDNRGHHARQFSDNGDRRTLFGRFLRKRPGRRPKLIWRVRSHRTCRHGLEPDGGDFPEYSLIPVRQDAFLDRQAGFHRCQHRGPAILSRKAKICSSVLPDTASSFARIAGRSAPACPASHAGAFLRQWRRVISADPSWAADSLSTR